jgi:hypothetical protein
MVCQDKMKRDMRGNPAVAMTGGGHRCSARRFDFGEKVTVLLKRNQSRLTSRKIYDPDVGNAGHRDQRARRRAMGLLPAASCNGERLALQFRGFAEQDRAAGAQLRNRRNDDITIDRVALGRRVLCRRAARFPFCASSLAA